MSPSYDAPHQLGPVEKRALLAGLIRNGAAGFKVFPVAYAQERLWFLEQLAPGNPTYSIPAAVQMEGVLDVAALERALAELVRRHEALRTTFSTRAGRPVQVVAPPTPLPLPMVDLTDIPTAARHLEASR